MLGIAVAGSLGIGMVSEQASAKTPAMTVKTTYMCNGFKIDVKTKIWGWDSGAPIQDEDVLKAIKSGKEVLAAGRVSWSAVRLGAFTTGLRGDALLGITEAGTQRVWPDHPLLRNCSSPLVRASSRSHPDFLTIDPAGRAKGNSIDVRTYRP